MRTFIPPKNCILRSELAMQLFPSPTPRQAVAKMNYWISGDKKLLRELKRAGYRAKKHFFRPATIRVFKEYFG